MGTTGRLVAWRDEVSAAAATDRTGAAAATTAALGAGLLAVGAATGVGPPCPMRAATGIPCPFCGTTGLARTIVSGDVAGALRDDPAGVVALAIVALLAVGFVLRAVGARRLPRRSPAVMAALVAAIGVHWATTLVGGVAT